MPPDKRGWRPSVQRGQSNAVQTLIVDTLKVWREAERVLQELPPLDANHEAARLLVIELRALYAEVSEASALTAERIAGYRAVLEQATARISTLRVGA